MPHAAMDLARPGDIAVADDAEEKEADVAKRILEDGMRPPAVHRMARRPAGGPCQIAEFVSLETY